MIDREVRRHDDGAIPPVPAGRSSMRLRVTGKLQLAQRGPVLLTDEGAWLLEAEKDLRSLVGQTIVAEGERHGLDHLRVDYAAPARDRP